MMQKNEKIAIKGSAYYLLENAVQKGDKYIAVVEDVYHKKRFVKYTTLDNKHACKYLQAEGRFQMNFPYIECIYGEFTHTTKSGQKIYGVMGEYIEGNTLEEYINLHKNLEIREVLRYYIQLLKAVQYYSEFIKYSPFTHRDLKPQNIMVTFEKRIVIIDFDCANVPDYQAKNVGGTVGYSDPRVFRTWKADMQMDIYSLGRIFFYLLNGEEYFSTEEKRRFPYLPEQVLYGSETKRFQKKYQKEFYAPLRKILAKMVQTPENRYHRIGNILDELESYIKTYFPKDYEDICYDPIFLNQSKKTSEEKDVEILAIVKKGNMMQKESIHLKTYEMYEFVVGKECILKLYHFDGEHVFYIPMKEMKYKRLNYEIQKEAHFVFGDIEIYFHIHKEV